MSFTGFTARGLELLGTLPTYDRDAFQNAAAVYREEILERSKAFVDELGPALRSSVSQGIQFAAQTNQSISPINNDLRFNPHAAPYKDFLLFRFWEGADRRLAPTLYVRVGAEDVGFAVGAPFPSERMATVREAMATEGEKLAAAVGKLVRYQRAEVVGEQLKRVPAPYDEDHPRADLLRHKSLQVRWRADPKGRVSRPSFVPFCRDQLAKAAGVHSWLVEYLA